MIRAEVTVTLFDDNEQLGSAMNVVRQSHCLTEKEHPTIFLADVAFAATTAMYAAKALSQVTNLNLHPYTG